MAAADAVAGAATDDGGAAVTMVKMAEMPVEFLRWVLEQDKDDYRVPTLEEDYTPEELAEAKDTICTVIRCLQIAYDEFDEFRGWVRGALENDSCIMIREDMLFLDPKEWQESIDQEWAEARQELQMELTKPLGPHLYMLSAYLSLLYHYAAPVPHVLGAIGTC